MGHIIFLFLSSNYIIILIHQQVREPLEAQSTFTPHSWIRFMSTNITFMFRVKLITVVQVQVSYRSIVYLYIRFQLQVYSLPVYQVLAPELQFTCISGSSSRSIVYTHIRFQLQVYSLPYIRFQLQVNSLLVYQVLAPGLQFT